MYQLRKLENNLETVLKKFNVIETIDIKLTKNESFDLQINNLVKYKDNQNLSEIIENFQRELDSEPFIEKYEIGEKNFINIEINLDEFFKTVENIRNFIKVLSPKKIIFDYGGPNIGKPLHVGHLRSLNIGRSLYNVNIKGFTCPPNLSYEELSDEKYIDDINTKNPDILWVSLGFPKQEKSMNLIKKNNMIKTNMIGVGAVFEWVAGTKIKAPEWLANIGLEWLLRLIQEPKRLFRRYLVDNFLFIIYFIKQYIRN